MRTFLTLAIMLAGSCCFAEPQTVEVQGVEYLEAGEEVFKRVKNSDFEVGDKVVLQDKRNPETTTKAEIIQVMDGSVIFKTVE